MKQTKDTRNGVWVTPHAFFDPLQKEFGLEVDTAAAADNAMLPKFFCEADSAFDHDWKGLRAWCNPPYGRKDIYRWVERCATGGRPWSSPCSRRAPTPAGSMTSSTRNPVWKSVLSKAGLNSPAPKVPASSHPWSLFSKERN